MQPWVWVIILIVAIVIVWWLLAGSAKEEPPHIEPHHVEVEAAEDEEISPAEPQTAEGSEPPKQDDLTILEGIGPKVNSLLQGAGIQTFAQLSAADLNQVKGILEANKLQFLDPTSWPDQAKLAAEGNWEALQALQDSLKGGR